MRTRVALLACLSGLAPALALGQAAGEVTITESSTSSQGGLSDRVINIADEVTDLVLANLTVRNDYGLTHDEHDHQFAIRSGGRMTGMPGTAESTGRDAIDWLRRVGMVANAPPPG